MSNYDDDDVFGQQLVKQTAKIVGDEASKLKAELHQERNERAKLAKQVGELKDQVSGLEKRLTAMENERNTHSNTCEEVLQRVFTAGLLSLAPINDGQIQNQFQLTATPLGLVNAQEEANQPSGAKRKQQLSQSVKKRQKHTEGSHEDIEDVPAELRERIRPYFKKDHSATNDYLNDVQRAYIKFKTYQAHEAKEQVSTPLAKSVICEGAKHGIWPEYFQPSEMPFDQYVKERLRNERKSLRRKSALAGQMEMVNQYINSSMDKSLCEDE